jgi:hypothetical protein
MIGFQQGRLKSRAFCAYNGTRAASIVADAGGVLLVGADGILPAAIIADEGFDSKAEGGPAGGCYSAIEDSSRGATWALYAMQGNFSIAP